jgi:anti-anti-sigma factor
MNPLRSASQLLRSPRQVGDALAAAVHGEIDHNNSPELRTALFDLVDRVKPKRVVLNLAHVPYMDSSAIAVLVELLRKLGRARGRLALTDLQPRVRGLLEIARLDTLFVLADREDQALG